MNEAKVKQVKSIFSYHNLQMVLSQLESKINSIQSLLIVKLACIKPSHYFSIRFRYISTFCFTKFLEFLKSFLFIFSIGPWPYLITRMKYKPNWFGFTKLNEWLSRWYFEHFLTQSTVSRFNSLKNVFEIFRFKFE